MSSVLKYAYAKNIYGIMLLFDEIVWALSIR
jgi:hypothetical protein